MDTFLPQRSGAYCSTPEDIAYYIPFFRGEGMKLNIHDRQTNAVKNFIFLPKPNFFE